MASGGGGGELDVSNMIPCPCHEWPCMWNKIDLFHYTYRSEFNRVSSFYRDRGPVWPYHGQTVHSMVLAGFFYTGILDFTRCFECCLLVGDWHLHAGMSPIAVHALRSRRCKYVCGLPCGNVPLISQITTINPMYRTHNDVIIMYGDVIQFNRRLAIPNNISYIGQQ